MPQAKSMECLLKMKEIIAWKSSIGDWGEERLYGAPVAVVDVETTGLNPSECRVVQLAVVHTNLGMGNAEVVYNELINPGCAIPSSTTRVHKITDAMVSGLGGFCDHAERLRELLCGRIISAYNLPYDYAVLNAELCRHELSPLPWFGICGMILAKYVDTGRGRGYHRLGSVAKRRGHTFTAHDAAEDALVTAKILDGLLGEASRKAGRKFGSVREFWSFQMEVAICQERELRKHYGGGNGRGWPWTDW